VYLRRPDTRKWCTLLWRFFTFQLTPTSNDLRLQVRVPHERIAVLDAFATRAEELAV
jgi:hypothetical protein